MKRCALGALAVVLAGCSSAAQTGKIRPSPTGPMTAASYETVTKHMAKQMLRPLALANMAKKGDARSFVVGLLACAVEARLDARKLRTLKPPKASAMEHRYFGLWVRDIGAGCSKLADSVRTGSKAEGQEAERLLGQATSEMSLANAVRPTS